MSNSKIGINLSVQSRMATKSLSNMSTKFVQLSRTGKQADKSISGLTRAMGGASKVASKVAVGYNNITSSIQKMLKVARLVGSVFVALKITDAIKSSMDSIESIHLYSVAMGEFAETTAVAVSRLSELSGVDMTTMLDTVGQYNMLARSMGVTSKNAVTLSENANRLALDLSSLTNRDTIQVAEDIRSGLIGQSKTMYKYGIDVTEAALKQEALNQGIEKSVRHMTQAEKMQLRYSVMLKQSSLAHGDFADTINQPANQIRILSERFMTLSRTVGSIFIPTMSKLLPILNAFVIVLTKMAQKLSVLVGFTPEPIKNMENNFIGVMDEVEDTGDAVDDLRKKIGKLAGFDQLNILGSPETESSTETIDMSPINIDLGGYDSNVEGMIQKAEEWVIRIEEKLTKGFGKIKETFEKIKKVMGPVTDAFKKLWNDGLKKLGTFAYKNLESFYKKVLKPIGGWFLGEKGLPRFFNITNDLLNKINWDKLMKSVDGFRESLVRLITGLGDILLDAYEQLVAPFINAFVSDFIPRINDIFSKMFDGLDIEGMRETLGKLYDALRPVGEFVGQGLADFMEHVLAPLMSWTFNTGLKVFLEGITKALEAVDWEDMRQKLLDIWEALKPLAENVGGGLVWFYENALVPLASIIIGDVVPAFLRTIRCVLDALNPILEAFKPVGKWLVENFLVPIATITTFAVVGLLDGLTESLGKLTDWVNENQTATTVILSILTALAGGALATKGLVKVGAGAAALKDVLETAYLLLLEYGVGGLLAKAGGLISTFLTVTIPALVLAAFAVYMGFLWEHREKLGAFMDKIATAFAEFIVYGIVEPVIRFVEFLYNKFIESRDETIAAFNFVKDKIIEIWGNVVEWLEDHVFVIFSKEFWTDLMTNVGEGFKTGFKNAINGAIGLFNKFIDWVNDKMNFSWKGITIGGKEIVKAGGVQLITIPNVPQLARGGTVDAGQAFIAGEAGAELTGTYKGKTTVMPLENTSFISAMQEAVKVGVREAMANNNNAGGDTQIEVNVGGRTLVDEVIKGVNRETRRTGKLVFDI